MPWAVMVMGRGVGLTNHTNYDAVYAGDQIMMFCMLVTKWVKYRSI